ncbi:hypothetical protein [Legionella spiritensis]|uniref:hypothetical protein n=1 Tax=Legionella spiritensis TaxID=452 RepID=UPI000F6C2C0D|nr:hypothetical protein [Legionella spiritensis]VEG90503.1 Uncharacterised protein [Legionella spiritensis]
MSKQKGKIAASSVTDGWTPMKHTRQVLSAWRDKILHGDLTITDIEKLEKDIVSGGGYHPLTIDSQNKLTYDDQGYTQQEAVIDFVLAVCPYLSAARLYRLTEMALAKEISGAVDNTFLRNNELARYLLVYETGIHTKTEEIPDVLKAHLEPLTRQFSEESCKNIINHSILKTLENLRDNHHGFEALRLSKPIDSDFVKELKTKYLVERAGFCYETKDARQYKGKADRSMEKTELPAWLVDIYSPVKRVARKPRPGILHFFKPHKPGVKEKSPVKERSLYNDVL